MRLREGLVAYDMDGGQVLVSADGTLGGMVRGNATAAFIVNCLREETDEAEIVAAMAARYDAPREQIAADVRRIVAQLRELGAIEE